MSSAPPFTLSGWNLLPGLLIFVSPSLLPPLSSPGPSPLPRAGTTDVNDQALSAWVLQVQPLSHTPLVQKTHSHGLLNELFWISDPLFSVRSVSPATSISHITLPAFVTIRMSHQSDSSLEVQGLSFLFMKHSRGLTLCLSIVCSKQLSIFNKTSFQT